MLPEPGSRSPRPRPGLSGAPAPDRTDVLDRPVSTEPITADRPTSFSRVAKAQGVTPGAIDNLLEQLPSGLMLVDRDGRVVYANGAARVLGAERLEPLQWAVTRALLTEDAVREDEIEVAAHGQPRRWLSAQVVPVRVAGLGVNAAFVMLSDVTAKTRMRGWTPIIDTLINL